MRKKLLQKVKRYIDSENFIMSRPNIFEQVIDALNRSGCRYVIVGGLAVNLHGYQRFTSDIDVEIDLSPRAAQLAIKSIFDLGFKPRVPIAPEDFLDSAKRKDWIENKKAKVISFLNADHPTFAIDIFIDPPLSFEEVYLTAKTVPIGGISATIASIESLIKMKKIADRDQDKLDIKMLEKILTHRQSEHGR